MFDIYLTETGHSGLFSAKALLTTAGILSFRFSGPRSLVVDLLDVQPRLKVTAVAYKLLDAIHRYAYEKDCTIRFRCPKAKAINDQQIAQELAELYTAGESCLTIREFINKAEVIHNHQVS